MVRYHLLYRNSSANICVLMDLLNVQRTSAVCVTDSSTVSTNCTVYKAVSKVQAGVYWNSSQWRVHQNSSEHMESKIIWMDAIKSTVGHIKMAKLLFGQCVFIAKCVNKTAYCLTVTLCRLQYSVCTVSIPQSTK